LNSVSDGFMSAHVIQHSANENRYDRHLERREDVTQMGITG